jgi:hypothetical protein
MLWRKEMNNFQKSLKEVLLPERREEINHSPLFTYCPDSIDWGFNQALDLIEKNIEGCRLDEAHIRRLIRSNIYKKEVPQIGKVKIRGYEKSAQAITKNAKAVKNEP